MGNQMARRATFVLPLAVLALLAVYFMQGLGRDPQAVPSPLIDKPVPDFTLAAIEGETQGLAREDLLGQVSLVNIWGSWCAACRFEHPLFMEIKAQDLVPIHGIDWREKNRTDGPAWLKKYGNPYTRIGDDPESRGAIAFGVTGAPETFVVDADGIIRFKHAGPITRELWERKIWPLVKELRAQSS